MIRIDEIYKHTFWPWFRANRPGTRMFFCDPFGHTDTEHLFNLADPGAKETDYVFMHDQEPIHLDSFEPLFDLVQQRTDTIGTTYQDPVRMGGCALDNHWVRAFPRPPGHVVVSERGEFVDELERKYGWQPHYYFFHGWAALDWYRGYDRTYLIARARDRQPTRTFMSPNRIVAGKRDHRVLFLYNIFKNNLENNYISAPRTCPYEGVDIIDIASRYYNTYPDIEQVFLYADLPRLFEGEDEQRMTSYELSNFAEAADSLIYVATETVYYGRRSHLTEKTFKPIALEMPFVLVAPQGSLAYLREYGFRTFSPWIDESYDLIADPVLRIEAVTRILLELEARSAADKRKFWQDILPIVEHNYNHFYRGGFEQILWAELMTMLAGFERYDLEYVE
jgi:hypothetical protein